MSLANENTSKNSKLRHSELASKHDKKVVVAKPFTRTTQGGGTMTTLNTTASENNRASIPFGVS